MNNCAATPASVGPNPAIVCPVEPMLAGWRLSTVTYAWRMTGLWIACLVTFVLLVMLLRQVTIVAHLLGRGAAWALGLTGRAREGLLVVHTVAISRRLRMAGLWIACLNAFVVARPLRQATIVGPLLSLSHAHSGQRCCLGPGTDRPSQGRASRTHCRHFQASVRPRVAGEVLVMEAMIASGIGEGHEPAERRRLLWIQEQANVVACLM